MYLDSQYCLLEVSGHNTHAVLLGSSGTQEPNGDLFSGGSYLTPKLLHVRVGIHLQRSLGLLRLVER